MRHRAVAIASVVVTLAAGACNKGAAQESLRVAEEALDGARADLEAFAPGELGRLRETLETAHADLGDGRYTDALRAAQAFPARVRVAHARVERRRRELLSVWGEHSRRVPSRLNRLERRVGLLSESSPGVAEARQALGEIKVAWARARRTHQEGDLARAVAVAATVEAELEALARRLSPPAVPRLATAAEQGEGP